MLTGRYHAGDMGDIGHMVSANLISDLLDLFEINDPGIGAGAGNDDLGFMLPRQLPHLVVIDQFLIFGNAVGYDLIEFAAEV